eukprot:7887025-Pyramimonas_sp.AAC.1
MGRTLAARGPNDSREGGICSPRGPMASRGGGICIRTMIPPPETARLSETVSAAAVSTCSCP